MKVLMLRHDTDGSMSWSTYRADNPEELYAVLDADIHASLNTIGVKKLEIFPEAYADE